MSETIEFDAERERLQRKMEENADEQAELALQDETGVAASYLSQLQERGTALNSYHEVLGNDAIDADEITIRKLTYGDSIFLEDFLDNHEEVHRGPAFIAIGTVDAPYLQHDPETFKRNPDDVLETVREVLDLDIPFARWLEERIGEKSHLGEDMGNGYTDLLVGTLIQKAEETTSADG